MHNIIDVNLDKTKQKKSMQKGGFKKNCVT